MLSLLSRVPRLTILATSRQRLFVAGERELAVPPLPVPPEDAGAVSPEVLMRVPSVQLFADRAQAARPDFQITARGAEAVAALCRRLEGIPLALELAASWAQALTPAQMLARTQQGPGGQAARRTKGVADRHRTLWATIAWGYDLLPPELRRFWARLSVFRRGWTAEAAGGVCREPSALFGLTQLRARSLVLAEEAGDGMRWRMLEALRDFGGSAWSRRSARRPPAPTPSISWPSLWPPS